MEIKNEKPLKTVYQKWDSGYYTGGLGSFQTHLFNAYRLAGAVNKKKLEIAFPEWFVNKS